MRLRTSSRSRPRVGFGLFFGRPFHNEQPVTDTDGAKSSGVSAKNKFGGSLIRKRCHYLLPVQPRDKMQNIFQSDPSERSAGGLHRHKPTVTTKCHLRRSPYVV